MPKSVNALFSKGLLDIAVPTGSSRVLPRYLADRDRVWIERLLDLYQSMEGKRRDELERRINFERPQSVAPKRWLAMASLLAKMHSFEVSAPVSPPALRAEVFRKAAARRKQGLGSPGELLSQQAEDYDATPQELRQWLYADLPQARVLQPTEQPNCSELVQHYNMALAQSLLLRARYVTVLVEGNVKGLLRFARLQGLLCLARSVEPVSCRAGESRAIEAAPAGPHAKLQLSGPLAVLRHTTKYGRSLAAWLPVVVRSRDWSLEAECVLDGVPLRFLASARDAIGTTHAPLKRFDSKVEERFFRDLAKKASSWEVRRETDAIQLGRRIVSADFCLVHRDTQRVVYVEIVGYWSERYLRDKLAVLERLPRQHRWLVCVDESLDSATAKKIAALPHAFVFRRWIDIDRFLVHMRR